MTPPHELHLRAMKLVRTIAKSEQAVWVQNPLARQIRGEAQAIVDKAAEILE